MLRKPLALAAAGVALAAPAPALAMHGHGEFGIARATEPGIPGAARADAARLRAGRSPVVQLARRGNRRSCHGRLSLRAPQALGASALHHVS